MTFEFFKVQIQRLRSEKKWADSYGTERMDAIWEWCQRMRAETFEKVITQAIGNCVNPPLVKDLKEIYVSVRSQELVKPPIKCRYCDDRGQIYAYSRTNPKDPLAGDDFACNHCELGKKTMKLRMWNDERLIEYIPRFCTGEVQIGSEVFSVNHLIQQAFKKMESV